MKRLRLLLPALATLTALAGCARAPSKVSGRLQMDGAPIADAEVVFHPESTNVSPFGGTTGPDGSFTLQPGADGKGPPPGRYKVAVSRYVSADGKAPPPNDLVMLKLGGKVRNSLPAVYEDPTRSPLTAEVTGGPNDVELALKKRP